MPNTQLNHHHHTPTSKKYPLCLLAHDMDVPMNVGSLFRITDALGIEKIYLSGTSIVPPNSKLKKTSRSTEKYVPYAYDNDPLRIVENLKVLDYTIISLEITSASIDIADLSVRPAEKIALIVGAENAGVPDALLAVSDKTVHIPMLGVNSSMNVATACAIAAYEIIRRYRS